MQANGNTAAVAASNGGSAAAVALSPQDLENITVTQAFRKNNLVITYFRDMYEDGLGMPTISHVELTDRDPIQIPVIDKKGRQYTYLGDCEPWSWRQMLAGMTDDVLTQLLGSPRKGVRRIWCAPIPDSYAHTRDWAQIRHLLPANSQILIWDFFLLRADGNTMRLHPHWKAKKVSVSYASDPPRGQPPRRGKSGGKGTPGTYSSITAANYPAGPAHGGAATDGGGGAASTPNDREGSLDADQHGYGDTDGHGRGDSDIHSPGDCNDAASDTHSFGGEDTTAWATTNAAPTQGSGRAHEV